MDVSFSAWRHSRKESMVLKGASFSFLFDRRYTNRLNRMSRIFFEAYVVATKELNAQEDRFPSLSEIDAKMESGAVYAFKDRLMKNTEFFEEVKVSGVSYLVPRALKFIDASGIYTDLVLDFDEGKVILPSRRKTLEPLGTEITIEEESHEIETPELEVEPHEHIQSQDEPLLSREAADEGSKTRQYPIDASEPHIEVEESEMEQAPTTKLESVNEKVDGSAFQIKKSALEGKARMRPKTLVLIFMAFLLVGAVVLLAGILPSGDSMLVEYSAYLSNISNEGYLGLDIYNSRRMPNEIEMTLPQNLDKSISAQGGIVTITHADKTLVRLNSSSDASVRIYLHGNWTSIPVSLSLAVPKGFDSSLVVHGKDYFVTRANDTLILRFNLTEDGLNFDQSYSTKH